VRKQIFRTRLAAHRQAVQEFITQARCKPWRWLMLPNLEHSTSRLNLVPCAPSGNEPSAPQFSSSQARLKAHGIDYIGPIAQLPGLLGIYFYDPNGIRLEFACQPEDGEAPAVIPCITQTKAEARGELATLPGVTPEWIEMRLAALPG
jgi:hypothetical protein